MLKLKNGVLLIDSFGEGHFIKIVKDGYLDYNYDASEDCPNWKNFMRECFSFSDRRTLQEWMGLLLLENIVSPTLLITRLPDMNPESSAVLAVMGHLFKLKDVEHEITHCAMLFNFLEKEAVALEYHNHHMTAEEAKKLPGAVTITLQKYKEAADLSELSGILNWAIEGGKRYIGQNLKFSNQIIIH